MPRKSNNSKNAYKPYTGATNLERGRAAELREKFYVSKPERNDLNRIVHETHSKPTKIEMPQKNDSWKIKSSWKGH